METTYFDENFKNDLIIKYNIEENFRFAEFTFGDVQIVFKEILCSNKDGSNRVDILNALSNNYLKEIAHFVAIEESLI